MIMISWYKLADPTSVDGKKQEGYSRIRIGRLFLAWMSNKRAKEMLTKELANTFVTEEIVDDNEKSVEDFDLNEAIQNTDVTEKVFEAKHDELRVTEPTELYDKTGSRILAGMSIKHVSHPQIKQVREVRGVLFAGELKVSTYGADDLEIVNNPSK